MRQHKRFYAQYTMLLASIDLLVFFMRLYHDFTMRIASINQSDLFDIGGELFDRIVRKAHYNEKEARDLIRYE